MAKSSQATPQAQNAVGVAVASAVATVEATGAAEAAIQPAQGLETFVEYCNLDGLMAEKVAALGALVEACTSPLARYLLGKAWMEQSIALRGIVVKTAQNNRTRLAQALAALTPAIVLPTTSPVKSPEAERKATERKTAKAAETPKERAAREAYEAAQAAAKVEAEAAKARIGNLRKRITELAKEATEATLEATVKSLTKANEASKAKAEAEG